MKKSGDPIAKEHLEMKEDERILEEGKILGYNVFKMNDETRKICLENEKKTPRPIVGKFSDHVKKYY